ncbi:MAG: topoisomerase DNA-binding C4 zinc finger domain-containing protein, partial [Flavobacteriaceae bacterium]|nr:topoisomerase DNA-binding C4 zinc finger domain-containing protein [Flavobacteriaceae bacterium]
CKSCGYPIIRIDMGEKGISDMCINPDCSSRTSNTEKKESGGTKDQTKKAVEIIGKCQDANCKGNLIIRFSPKKGQYFIGCSKYPKCRKAYSLPQDGRVITTEDKCKSCGYPIIRIDMGEKGISDMCINPDCSEKK